MKEFIPIGKEAVKLEGANLIEASAGTGKTYSIGLLALRLLLETDIRIGNILMVTFTKSAVAELAERIREFILLGIKAARGEAIDEKPIQELINHHGDHRDALQKLTRAFRELDEASIQTIHSFCQESLNTYALDSNQPFGLSLETEVLNIAEDYLKVFWRREISSLSISDINEWKTHIDYEFFKEAIKEAIGGREYAFSNEAYKISIKKYKKEIKKFAIHLKENKSHLEKKINDSTITGFTDNRKKPVIGFLDNPEEFKKWLENVNKSQYIEDCCTTLFTKEKKLMLELKQLKANVIHTLFAECVEEVKKNVKAHLSRNHLLTYDEIIVKMSEAVKNKNFRSQLRKKFSAVFIDEFQDTDKLQYKIYKKLFGKGKVLFFIGDPKQSIYAWRKADLNTYTKAKNKIVESNRFEMSTNFRSSEAYVDAVNQFYLGANEDPFQNGKDEVKIEYIPVKAMDQKSEGLTWKGKPVKCLQTFRENKNRINFKIPLLVGEILSDDYKLNGNEVKKSDIGILVRTNKEARHIKKLLTREGIQAITIDDTKIFEDSIEAKFIGYILEATLNTTKSNIQKALLNNFTVYRYDQVTNLDTDELVDVFRSFRNTWLSSGIYTMMREYLNYFNVYRNLLKKENPSGSRILSNINQIMEILQEKENQQELKPEGLLDKLSKLISGISMDGDEYEQRIESDEDAVKILTIHKAKGLEYPIVIAPNLDLSHKQINLFKAFSYCDPKDKKFKFYLRSLEGDGCKTHHELQRMQENCRLLYVALTRAKYNTFLFKNEKEEETTLCNFIQADHFNDCITIPEIMKKVEIPPLPTTWGQGLELEKFELADKTHGKLSFSELSIHGSHPFRESLMKYEPGYDQFIFKDIPGGKNMGTMLHYLFENIDFKDHTGHQEEVDKLVNRYYPDKADLLGERLVEMVDHVLNSHIELPDGTSLILKNLESDKKLNEMEFDLSMEDICLADLKDFDLGKDIEINCNMAISKEKGLLNGFIDLFFVHDSKYYILDWKSNFLGDSLEHYAQGDTMKKALNEGNYHLQYLIYSMAIKNYLEARLPEFDYDTHFGGAIYVYLRGARKGTGHGIYTNRPSLEQVETLERIFQETSPN